MKAIGTFILGFISCGVIVILAISDKDANVRARHQNEVNQLIDSLAKCNGITKRHVCYPPYKNN